MSSDPQSSGPTTGVRPVPRRKVRVLFLNDTARNGGPGRSLYYLLKFLDPHVIHRSVVLPRAGVISELLTGGNGSRGLPSVVDDLVFEPTLVESPIEPWSRPIVRSDFQAPFALKSARAAGNVARGGWAIAKLASLARRGRYDLVYCNGTSADFAGGAIAWTSRVPALWHVRYTSLPRGARSVHRRLAASRGVRRILCVSKAAATLFPHCLEKVVVIHNALDVDEFAVEGIKPSLRAEIGVDANAVIFGSQGRILRRKGYIEMIRAAKLALDAMTPEERAQARFVVLGDTPEDESEDHLAECRALAGSLGIEREVRFLGFRRDVKPYVADFDVAVLPSIYADPLPRAVLESMAMGKPVIAFDVGGVSEMLEDGRSGTLLRGDPPDVAGLAQQFLRYLRDPELRQGQGRLARRRIESTFDASLETRRIQDEIVSASGLAS
jgi:glycosyltransferase involved in cell wall biosynthesis